MKKQDKSFDRKARLSGFALVFKILTKCPEFIILTKIALVESPEENFRVIYLA